MNGGLAFHVIQHSKPLWAIAFFEVKPRQPHRCVTLKRLPESKTCMRAHSRVLEYWTVGSAGLSKTPTPGGVSWDFGMVHHRAVRPPLMVVPEPCSYVTMGCWTIGSQQLWTLHNGGIMFMGHASDIHLNLIHSLNMGDLLSRK
jgi:hypothetical protein